MKTTFVTGFSASGFQMYGERMVRSFDQFNDAGFELMVYATDVTKNQKIYESLWLKHILTYHQEDIVGLNEFLDMYKGSSTVAGKGAFDKWNDKERRAKYSYRFDAYKFCRMVFTMWEAAHTIHNGYMIWLDGDNVVKQQIPEDIAERSLPDDCDYAYLGREPKHTETGFLVFRLPEALPILDAWVAYYKDGMFMDQKEWHSAFLFDRAREQFPDIKGNNFTPGGRGHVIHKCWVGKVFDHLKGARKISGKSPEAR